MACAILVWTACVGARRTRAEHHAHPSAGLLPALAKCDLLKARRRHFPASATATPRTPNRVAAIAEPNFRGCAFANASAEGPQSDSKVSENVHELPRLDATSVRPCVRRKIARGAAPSTPKRNIQLRDNETPPVSNLDSICSAGGARFLGSPRRARPALRITSISPKLRLHALTHSAARSVARPLQ
jgi:hypothetical protein